MSITALTWITLYCAAAVLSFSQEQGEETQTATVQTNAGSAEALRVWPLAHAQPR